MREPGLIKKLDEEVVNRIAAGEIVQRPANALKELIENCLDAESTNILITVKAGGLKYLQIQDNGTGIRHENLDIVCERFTTSKLEEYDDLRKICTYGFRGEALASISHIAHLTILTKTAAEKCAYRATYQDGKLKGPIKPRAGNNGTQITVEDLFYNVLTRKRALKSPSEEYSHIMEVVGSYAIHNCAIGFTLKKYGENTDIKTPIGSSVIENVRIIYGNTVARELIEINLLDGAVRMKLKGFISNVNYSNKKGVVLLFINNRLVDSSSIKKAIESVYTTYLPKNTHPFVYLSLELDPSNVDVNVHPTKHEVHFLYEEQIIEKIKSCIEAKLLSCSSTRVLYTQARLPGATKITEETRKPNENAKVHASNLVRSSSDTQKIDKFFPLLRLDSKDNIVNLNRENATNVDVSTNHDRNVDDEREPIDLNSETNVNDNENRLDDRMDTSEVNEACDVNNKQHSHKNSETNKLSESIFDESLNDDPKEETNLKEKWKSYTAADKGDDVYIDPKESFKTRKFSYERIETRLTSVKQLRMDVENNCSTNLREILANLIFIGRIDMHKTLIQHSTNLYLCDSTKIAEELFYETLLYDFQNFGLIKMSNPLPLKELFVLGLNAQDNWDPELGEKEEMAQQMSELLISKKDMLQEYFSFEITADGKLTALPLLIDGHTPFMGALPTYLVKLVTEVNWDSEKECFDTFCRQTAMFYSQPNPDTRPEAVKAEEWKQEHVLYPVIRRNFLPPTCFTNNGAILQVASLSDLYKVFERC